MARSGGVRFRGPRLKIFKGLRVLVVDDDLDSRDIVCTLLVHGGASVFCADSAAEALVEFVASGTVYDAVVSDLAMPTRDGFWLIRQLKREASAAGRSIRAVALTGHAGPDVRAAALGCGFDVLLTKPFAVEALYRALLDPVPKAG